MTFIEIPGYAGRAWLARWRSFDRTPTRADQ